jgi:3-methylcrotonyl-CoA carboxylase alpha subunit
MKGREFDRILVANRGEIAWRIIRAIHRLDKVALVAYAENDRELPFVTEADEAWSLGSGDLSQTYLNIEKIVNLAKEARADAIHPGYGFLAENAQFARACEDSGIRFIGPSAEMIALMGHKSNAREIASKLGIPVLEGDTGDLVTLVKKRSRYTYPLLIKPAAGGGGKGMRIVRSADHFQQEATEASREALSYFGSGELYVEQYLEGSRHIEVQVIADQYGNSAHLFERECSLQRRYQKIIEEAPSGSVSDETRRKITSAALELVRGIGYTNAGTIEFLMDQNQHFYFMEMNTRIQVEHPVTELTTGIDLVREQITISEGHPLSFTQAGLTREGHAMEARIYAEDPVNDFLPSTGSLNAFDLPNGRNIRIDSGYRAGNQVVSWYDPMLAKIIVTGKNREDARKQLIKALKNTHITGLSTNRDFLVGLLDSPFFRENILHTRLLDLEMQELLSSIGQQRAGKPMETLLAVAGFISLEHVNEDDGSAVRTGSPWEQIGHWRILPGITIMWEKQAYYIKYRFGKGKEQMWLRLNDREYQVILEQRLGHHYRIRVNGQLMKVWGIRDHSEIHLDVDGHRFTLRRLDIPDRRYIPRNEIQKRHSSGEISAPLNGRVVQINVKEGDRVAEGVPLLVIESMKMENKMLSDHEAIVKQIEVSVGQQVRTNQLLLTLGSI